MRQELTILPVASLHPSQIVIYSEYHYDGYKTSRRNKQSTLEYFINNEGEIHYLKDEKNKAFYDSCRSAKGQVSKIAKKKITRAIDYVTAVTPQKKAYNRFTNKSFQYKLTFVTLTLPSKQIHDDKIIIRECLNQLLIELKKYHQVKNYVWRAEKQKNGNVHFHILCDKFIFFQELRDRWNRIINKLGYVDRYQKNQQNWHASGFKPRPYLFPTWPLRKQKAAYERGARTHWSSPNSTDIHKLYKIHNVKDYLSKYMGKDHHSPGDLNSNNLKKLSSKDLVNLKRYRKNRLKKRRKCNPKTNGRIWGCNREIGEAKGAKILIDSKIESELIKLDKCKKCKVYHSDYYSIFYIDYKKLQETGCSDLFKHIALYLFEKFGVAYNLEI